jgi:anti-sigma B factor antagonist
MSGLVPSADALRIDVSHRGTTMVVKLTGSADMEVCSDFRDRLVSLIDDNTKALIFDLSDLDFICSLGLGGIIAAHLRCRLNDGRVALVAPKAEIAELLEVTQLTRLFTIYDSVDAALAGVSGGGKPA